MKKGILPFFRTFLSMVTFAVCVLLLAACGGKQTSAPPSSSAGTGSVSFSAVWEAPPEGASKVLDLPRGGSRSSGVRPLALAGDVCADYGIEWVSMEVWSGTLKVAGDRFECWRHEGTLLNVPAGDNLSLQVFATVSGYTVPFWRLQGGQTFNLSVGEAKRLEGIAMSYVGPDGTPPSVVSFNPDNNATGLPATTTLRFSLSEPMVARTVTDNAAVVLVDGNSTKIPGRTVYDNASLSAVFYPSSRLTAGMRHTVTLSPSMTDTAAQGMISPVSWNFTVYAPGAWHGPFLLEVNDNSAFSPQIAMNGSGNAVAVWAQSDGPRNIWANRYSPSGGWGTATLIETDNAGPAYDPQVAMDGSGNAVAVWSQSDGTRTNIWANRYTPSGGWGTATLIETDNAGDASSPQVAMDGSGNAVAVWSQSDGTRTNIRANRYTPSGGWGTATLIETDNAGDASSPQVAMDGSGNAITVWEQSDGTRTNIRANRYTPSGGWGTATLIETDNVGDAGRTQVAMDGSGNAVAVWSQSDGTRTNIWANRFTPSGGWGMATLIETDNAGWADFPQVALDGSGNAVAVWSQSDGTRTNIWANRFTPSGGWGMATLIETDNAGWADFPQVALDGSGNAVAVWEQFDGTRINIWSNRYTPSGGWGSATLIETDNAGNASRTQVAMDGSGNAVAVWYQSDGTRSNIMGNRYAVSAEWGTTTLIEADNAGDAIAPQVAMDGSGNAAAVWEQSDGTRYNIWANRYTASVGWGTATLVETGNAGDASFPKIAMDRSGDAVAVWSQSDGIRTNIWANRYTPSGGWGTATLIETDNAGDASYPQVAMDGSGNAVAVWQQSDGTRLNIRANRYTPSGGWGTATLIETGNAGDASFPRIAMDGSGNAVAVWSQSDGTRFHIWANRYTPSGGWGTATLIETNNAGDASFPRIAMDATGSAVAVWSQSDGTRGTIWSNRYTPSGGWGAATLIETDNAEDAYSAQVAMDGSGNAVAVWKQSDGTRSNIWSNRYTPSGGWGGSTLVETDNSGDASYPQVAMDGTGYAVAVWSQSDGVRDSIWANRYTPSGGWGSAKLIETDNAGWVDSPQVAMDGSGNAIAVWERYDGTRFNIRANRYY